jgi:hypothetical protein
MDSIILTGLKQGKHQFTLEYPTVDGLSICLAHCACGFKTEIKNFRSYGGVKDLQSKWELHVGVKKP